MKLTSVSWLFSANLFAGSGIGTTNPPALDQVLETLTSVKSEFAPIVISDSGNLFLGVPGELNPTLNVAREKSDMTSIVLTDADFERLKYFQSVNGSGVKIEAINKQAQIRSYRITDGDKPDEFMLEDRRAVIRSQVK